MQEAFTNPLKSCFKSLALFFCICGWGEHKRRGLLSTRADLVMLEMNSNSNGLFSPWDSEAKPMEAWLLLSCLSTDSYEVCR